MQYYFVTCFYNLQFFLKVLLSKPLWGWDLMFYWICFIFVFLFVLLDIYICPQVGLLSTPLLEDLMFYWSNLEAFPVTSCGKYPCKDKYIILPTILHSVLSLTINKFVLLVVYFQVFSKHLLKLKVYMAVPTW